MYQVLARRWRPQSFEELVGQPHVARTLRNAIAAGRIAHAYLFAGVRGTGKTTVARILAKCLNCESGPTPTPCGRCTPCVEIAEGRAMDVLEMDAATRTGVDDIRELQEVVAYAPVRDPHKVLIIDEAHMLSKAASNALLKTLEEPPQRVVFILATTEIHRILPTILSRCQVFEFRRIPAKEILPHLRAVSEAEKISISDAALERIARAGEGSVRDALSVLEGVVSFSGSEVRDADALLLLGGVRVEVLADLLRALAARDAARMLAVLDGLLDEGHDLVHFWSELTGALRDLMLLRHLPGRDDLLSRSPEEASALDGAAKGLSDEELLRSFQIVADLEPGLKASALPRFLFEAALVRLASLGEVKPIEEVLRMVLGSEATAAAGGGAGGPTPARGDDGPPARRAPPVPTSRKVAPHETREPAASAPPPPAPDLAAALTADLHESKPMLAVALDHIASVSLEGDRLELRLAEGSDSVRGLLEREDNRAALEERASRLAGRPVRLVVAASGAEPAPQQQRRMPPQPSAGASAIPSRPFAPPQGPARGGGAGDASRQALLELASREPGLQKLLREFGAQVVDVRTLGATGEKAAGSEDPEVTGEP